MQQPRTKAVAIESEGQQIERRLQLWHRQDEASRRLAEIPGVGLLGATAAIATIGDAKVCRSGREFAAWLGLVPRQCGTGGRVRLLGISKRGDPYQGPGPESRHVPPHARRVSGWRKCPHL